MKPKPPAIDWRERSWLVHSVLCADRIRTDADVRFCALALAGEVGELCNLVKKKWRQEWGYAVDDPARLAAETVDELADVCIYLWLLAQTMEIDLDKVTAAKWLRVEPRFGPEAQRALATLASTYDSVPDRSPEEAQARGYRDIVMMVLEGDADRDPARFLGEVKVIAQRVAKAGG